MAQMNAQEYYENSDNHGSYSYSTLEEMVNFFMLNFTGDSTVLGNVKRSNVIAWLKKGIQQFTFNALREVRKVELELGDTLDIILPPNYVTYTRISYVNPETGELMALSLNPNIAIGSAFLQDHNADILFDDQGLILEGTTYHEHLTDRIGTQSSASLNRNCSGDTNWGMNAAANANGYFNIDTRLGKIHFSSDNAPRVIMLEYISDGLEYTNESDIKVNKLAEIALYNYVNWNLSSNKIGIQEYIVRRFKKDYDTSYRNTKVAMMKVNLNYTMLAMNIKKNWIR